MVSDADNNDDDGNTAMKIFCLAGWLDALLAAWLARWLAGCWLLAVSWLAVGLAGWLLAGCLVGWLAALAIRAGCSLVAPKMTPYLRQI